jgi:hypothetical protein
LSKLAKYSYKYGTDKKKTYIQIGKDSTTYTIRTDTLSSAKDAKCDSFANAIKKSNSYYDKGASYAAGTSFSVGVIIGLVIANAAFPPSVIVTIIVALLGGGATLYKAIDNFVDSYAQWKNARDLFVTIKTYA